MALRNQFTVSTIPGWLGAPAILPDRNDVVIIQKHSETSAAATFRNIRGLRQGS
jgi:hypothetical protein